MGRRNKENWAGGAGWKVPAPESSGWDKLRNRLGLTDAQLVELAGTTKEPIRTRQYARKWRNKKYVPTQYLERTRDKAKKVGDVWWRGAPLPATDWGEDNA